VIRRGLPFGCRALPPRRSGTVTSRRFCDAPGWSSGTQRRTSELADSSATGRSCPWAPSAQLITTARCFRDCNGRHDGANCLREPEHIVPSATSSSRVARR